jgi:small-conductance mechanosensitive channel
VTLGGIKGDVVDIGVLRTTLMEIGDWVNGDLYNGKMVRVANSFVFSAPVFNYSGEFPFLWDEMLVPIKTDGDYGLAEKLFAEILNDVVGDYAREAEKTWKKMTDSYRLENARVAPMVNFTFDENWITFTLRYVVDYKSRRSTKHELSRRVLDAIRNSEGRIEVASTALEITSFQR